MWEIYSLACCECVLDEDRMRATPEWISCLAGFFWRMQLAVWPFLLVSALIPPGGGSKTLGAIEDSARGPIQSRTVFQKGMNSATNGDVLLEGGDIRLEEASSAGREVGSAVN